MKIRYININLNSNYSKNNKWFIWIIFLLFIGYIVFDAVSRQKELESNGIHSIAIITYINSGNKGVRNIEYEFIIDNKTYVGYGEIPWLTCLPCEISDSGCLGTQINIIYSEKDPNIVETNYSESLIKIEEQDKSKIWDFIKMKVKSE